MAREIQSRAVSGQKEQTDTPTIASRGTDADGVCTRTLVLSPVPATTKWTPRFLLAEWEQVVDAWQLESWDAYRDVPRLSRKTRLPEARRAVLCPSLTGPVPD
jgi:hypothetical protein